MIPRFIHLNIHSEYSLVDGLINIKELIAEAISKGYPTLALTDQSNFFAAVKFYQAASQAGIKPLLGCHIYLENTEKETQPFTLLLLCQNNLGYRNLTELISQAYLEGQHQGYPILKWEWLAAKNEGLLVLSGAKEGDIGRALLTEEKGKIEQNLAFWKQYFKDRYYLEIQRTGHKEDETYIRRAILLANHHQLPLVATNAVRFLFKEDFEAHEARVCINKGDTLNDPKRPKFYTEQQFFKSQSEMEKLFSDLPTALLNSVEIAKRCNVKLELGTYHLPIFSVPQGSTVEECFSDLAKQGLKERLAISHPELLSEDKMNIYTERLERELKVIIDMEFASYFLIVADFIQWAKKEGIPVGPGRGSGAGSLVAFALKITDLDPLHYDLLFERFLNPERVSLPDFDVDFCMEGRDRVIEYVSRKYGRASVSQIITFGTMAAKAVVRDVGRVLNQPYGFVDKIAKLIPFELGITLDKALATENLLLERYQQEPEVAELIDLAKKLEGVVRNVGKHAGGIVISPSQLTDFCPLYCEENEGAIVTQFDKDDVETIGLVKFDFLGLRTLTILNETVKSIHAENIDLNLLPLDDPKTFELLKACKTTAVFQLESRGMKDLISRLQPDCFEDIIALAALYRPGPLQSGMVDDFIDRRHGLSKIEYPHPDLEPILKPTYGVILYQEQVMQIAQVLAGYTLGGADLLRRAMGKRKPEEMAKQRAFFIEGAEKRGISKEKSGTIFDLMEKFAGYGFNKSHSAAYALIAYQTAWLKAHYPAEFMAAVLSSDMDNTDKVFLFYQECKALGLIVRPPSINEGLFHFAANDQKEIVYGLGAIKGLGASAVAHIVEERQVGGAFTDLFQFCGRLDLRKVNKRTFEALIYSGALDVFGIDRAGLMASLGLALRYAEQEQERKASKQMDLFSSSGIELPQTFSYINAKPLELAEYLQGEKQALGFYLSAHPMDAYKGEFTSFTLSLGKMRPGDNLRVVGFIVGMRVILTKKKDRMAFIALDDSTGHIDVAIFPDLLTRHSSLLIKDQLIIIEGKVDTDAYSGGYRMAATKLLSLEEARTQYAKHLLLNLEGPFKGNAFFDDFNRILASFTPGSCPIRITYKNNDFKAQLGLGNNWKVRPEENLLEQLRALLGPTNAYFEYGQ